MAIDPVCRMNVDEQTPGGGKAQYWGKYFYFCSKECRISFRRAARQGQSLALRR